MRGNERRGVMKTWERGRSFSPPWKGQGGWASKAGEVVGCSDGGSQPDEACGDERRAWLG